VVDGTNPQHVAKLSGRIHEVLGGMVIK
jgi:hypothetical protein